MIFCACVIEAYNSQALRANSIIASNGVTPFEGKFIIPALLLLTNTLQRVLFTVVLLLLRSGETLATAPGDEDPECGVRTEAVNIRVLLDSWGYLTLLGQNDAIDGTAAFTTVNHHDDQHTKVSH